MKEKINRKNGIAVGIVLLVFIVLFMFHKPEMNMGDIVECNEGKYDGNKEYKLNLKENGFDLDYIRVIDEEDYCTYRVVLKEVTGSADYGFKSTDKTCRKGCFIQWKEDKPELTDYDLVYYCCS